MLEISGRSSRSRFARRSALLIFKDSEEHFFGSADGTILDEIWGPGLISLPPTLGGFVETVTLLDMASLSPRLELPRADTLSRAVPDLCVLSSERSSEETGWTFGVRAGGLFDLEFVGAGSDVADIFVGEFLGFRSPGGGGCG